MVRLGIMFRILFLLAGLVLPGLAAYTLADDYSGANFFDMMTFFTDVDPTKGYVNYVDQSTAQSLGMISTDNNTVVMRVDSTTPVASGRGRNSVRVQSDKSYNQGLWVVDLAHMPGGVCGTWPAWWATSSTKTWPTGGEIDIIENINDATTNFATLHTGGTGQLCTFQNQTQLTHSHMTTLGCDINSPGQQPNQGCAANDNRDDSFGAGFNSGGGGTYAMQWTSEAINVFFFPRSGNTPSDVLGASPNPSTWGTPTAIFSGGCDIPTFFKDQQMIFNIAFCGDWAGNEWASGACASKAPTCEQYVQNNPSAFQDSYWEINALKVYSDNGAPAAPAASQSVSSAAPSSVAPSSVAPSSVAPSSVAASSVAASSVAPSSVAPSVAPSSVAAAPSAPVVTVIVSAVQPQQPTTAPPIVVVTATVTAAPVEVTAVEVTTVAALQSDEFGTGSDGIAQRRRRRHLPRHLRNHLRSGNF